MLSSPDDYDMYVVDYDTNIATGSDSMYESGGELYDLLTSLAFSGKLVFVASQPKIGFYGHEKIPMEGLAESSRKQQIIDLQITIGRAPGSGTHCGYVGVVKNRRGSEGIYEPYIMSTSLNHVQISQAKYDLVRGNPSKLDRDQRKFDFLKDEYNASLFSANPNSLEGADESYKETIKEISESIKSKELENFKKTFDESEEKPF
jgi:hypothetical protein